METYGVDIGKFLVTDAGIVYLDIRDRILPYLHSQHENAELVTGVPEIEREEISAIQIVGKFLPMDDPASDVATKPVIQNQKASQLVLKLGVPSAHRQQVRVRERNRQNFAFCEHFIQTIDHLLRCCVYNFYAHDPALGKVLFAIHNGPQPILGNSEIRPPGSSSYFWRVARTSG